MIGQLAFQLLLSGPSEELIFRGFAITMFALILKRRIVGGAVSAANTAAALGIFSGICCERSRSVSYPMMMHSISNVVAVGVSAVATAIMG